MNVLNTVNLVQNASRLLVSRECSGAPASSVLSWLMILNLRAASCSFYSTS